MTALHVVIPHVNIAIDTWCLVLFLDLVYHVFNHGAHIEASRQLALTIWIGLDVDPYSLEF